MCDHILFMFMATWSDNQLLVELFLPHLPKGMKIRVMPIFDEAMRNNFTKYFSDDILFRITLTRDHLCIDKEVKLKMKTPFPFLKKRIYNFIFNLIEQYAYFFPIKDASQAIGNIDTIRYEILLNKLKQEEELELLNFQELHCFFNSIRHEEKAVKYEEKRKEKEELISFQSFQCFQDENLYNDAVDRLLHDCGDITNNEEQMKQNEVRMFILELEIFLDTELHEGLFDDMLHEVKALMSFEEEQFITDNKLFNPCDQNFLGEY